MKLKRLQADNDRLARKLTYLENELANTKDWARRYKAERDELQARIDRVREKAAGLLAKYAVPRDVQPGGQEK